MKYLNSSFIKLSATLGLFLFSSGASASTACNQLFSDSKGTQEPTQIISQISTGFISKTIKAQKTEIREDAVIYRSEALLDSNRKLEVNAVRWLELDSYVIDVHAKSIDSKVKSNKDFDLSIEGQGSFPTQGLKFTKNGIISAGSLGLQFNPGAFKNNSKIGAVVYLGIDSVKQVELVKENSTNYDSHAYTGIIKISDGVSVRIRAVDFVSAQAYTISLEILSTQVNSNTSVSGQISIQGNGPFPAGGLNLKMITDPSPESLDFDIRY